MNIRELFKNKKTCIYLLTIYIYIYMCMCNCRMFEDQELSRDDKTPSIVLKRMGNATVLLFKRRP